MQEHILECSYLGHSPHRRHAGTSFRDRALLCKPKAAFETKAGFRSIMVWFECTGKLTHTLQVLECMSLCLADFRKVGIPQFVYFVTQTAARASRRFAVYQSCSCSLAPSLSIFACLNVFTHGHSQKELSLLQPKVQNHTYGCSASAFNCIDCGRTFDRFSVKVDSSSDFESCYPPR